MICSDGFQSVLQLILMFEEKYILMENISQRPQKCTSIVKNKRNQYFIAKKVRVDDKKTMHQIGLMRTLSHPNIIQLHQILWEDPWAYIIEEYCEEGDLQYHLKRQAKSKKKVPEEIIARWMLQILLALQYLHHSKIIHRDIRPKNIFLTSRGNIKLGSFRASKQLQSQVNYASTLINSSYYMTPQLMEGKNYDCKVDLWAFGCVLYETCWLKPLVNVHNLADLVGKLSHGKVEELPNYYSRQLNMIYHKVMKKNPQQRVSAKELLKNNYFLSALEKFISDQGLSITLIGKVPIKKYKIHQHKYQRLKLKRGLVKTPSVQKKENLLPRIEGHSNSLEKQGSRCRSKELIITQAKTPNIKSNSSFVKDYPPRSISTQKKKIKTQTYSKSKEKAQKTQQKIETPKIIKKEGSKGSKFMLAPPLLPKPLKRIERTTTEIKPLKQEEVSGHFDVTMSKQSLSKQLANFQKKDLKQINENLNKMFQGWKLEQQQQVQFDFQQEGQLRLTSKQTKEDSANLIKTFKSKLEQLIEQINYKYCPDMQPIAEKACQFDSNSLSTFNPNFHT